MGPVPPVLEDEEDDDEPDQVVTLTSPLPAVAPPYRGFEYRVESLSTGQVADAAGFAALLNRTADDGWDLVEIVDAGADQRALVLRRPKAAVREHRRVGFNPHPES